MSHFGAKIQELIERRKMKASELSRSSGINDALISRWINGRQRFVDPEDLAKLTVAISENPRDRAELIHAHLLDEMAAPGCELIEIKIRGVRAAETVSYILKDAPAPPPLPLKTQRALDILAREAYFDADLRSLLMSLSNMIAPELRED